jgi:signal transduction histidine kinase
MKGWTFRTRLTVFYGCLVLLAGITILGVTYLLVEQNLNRQGEPSLNSSSEATPRPPGSGRSEAPVPDLNYDTIHDEVSADALRSLVVQGGIALGVVGLCAVTFCWLMADRVLRPLQKITETAHRVADRNLHERIALDGPQDEIKELADTFDSMLERLDRAFDSQARFVANASHELRTPLAINRTLLEVALKRPDPPPQLKDLGLTLLDVNARHERLVDGLLTLARSEQSVITKDPVDLADLARHLTEHADAGDIEVTTTLESAPTMGDTVLLERVVQNLVQNAIVYNVTGGWLSVTTRTRDHTAELAVANTGPVVPGYEVTGLFEPFRRLNNRVKSTHQGVGLGLSIVRSVARAHGGEVAAQPRSGGGLVVTVRLPSA